MLTGVGKEEGCRIKYQEQHKIQKCSGQVRKKTPHLSRRGRARAKGGRCQRAALVGKLLWARARVRALKQPAFVAQLRVRIV